MVNHYPLSQVTEFETFRHNTQTRDAIMQEKGIEGLASFLQQHVLVTYNPHSHLQTQTVMVKNPISHFLCLFEGIKTGLLASLSSRVL